MRIVGSIHHFSLLEMRLCRLGMPLGFACGYTRVSWSVSEIGR